MNHSFTLEKPDVKIKRVSVICLLLVLMLPCCKEKETRKQIIHYFNNDILRISELEQVALKDYGAVTGENYTSDQTLHKALTSKVIPTYSRFVTLLEEIHPPNEELRQLHYLYIQSARAYQTGFALLLSALEKRDPALTQGANRYLAEGRKKGKEWRKGFLALCKKHGVKLIFKK